jgi:hypothetical protein
MKAILRMFFLRHAAFQMSISDNHRLSYNAYTYCREDNKTKFLVQILLDLVILFVSMYTLYVGERSSGVRFQ